MSPFPLKQKIACALKIPAHGSSVGEWQTHRKWLFGEDGPDPGFPPPGFADPAPCSEQEHSAQSGSTVQQPQVT